MGQVAVFIYIICLQLGVVLNDDSQLICTCNEVCNGLAGLLKSHCLKAGLALLDLCNGENIENRKQENDSNNSGGIEFHH